MARKPGKAMEPPPLPEVLEPYLDAPFGGLFGSTAFAKVAEALIADPYTAYRSGDLEDLAGVSKPAAREALRTLVRLRLVEPRQDPCGDLVYMVDRRSSLFVALALLAYAIVDDREGTDTMAGAIRHFGASAGRNRKKTA